MEDAHRGGDSHGHHGAQYPGSMAPWTHMGGLSDIDVAKVDGRPSLVVVTHCSFPCSADVRRMPVLIINYISDNLHIAVPEYS